MSSIDTCDTNQLCDTGLAITSMDLFGFLFLFFFFIFKLTEFKSSLIGFLEKNFTDRDHAVDLFKPVAWEFIQHLLFFDVRPRQESFLCLSPPNKKIAEILFSGEDSELYWRVQIQSLVRELGSNKPQGTVKKLTKFVLNLYNLIFLLQNICVYVFVCVAFFLSEQPFKSQGQKLSQTPICSSIAKSYHSLQPNGL